MTGELAVAGSFLRDCKRRGNTVPSKTPIIIEHVKAKATTSPSVGKECCCHAIIPVIIEHEVPSNTPIFNS